ncbi:5-formyltetrahydrofolate cyclo-ligase [Halobacteriaceae archaeon SHR40]|uniref:5-formyltetrahydrofolate cyclo-ligase n=1 Tax=Halovenus amylolytica TaxID=2500550 RepID=UPI000FE3EAA2
MDKQQLRKEIWEELEETGEARFPFPPHGRIPNFAGAKDAAERLTELDTWQDADAIKSNPDSPQLPVRRAALREGKTLYMAVPRLRDEDCFLKLDPAEIDDIDHATTIGGSSEVGVQVGPKEMEPIDLIVSGSVAVDEQGARVGKGEGYSDLEFAILREFGLVGDGTTTVSTVHEMQVVDREIPTDAHDVPIEHLCTPERAIATEVAGAKPSGIDWGALPAEKIEEIPILQRLHAQ